MDRMEQESWRESHDGDQLHYASLMKFKCFRSRTVATERKIRVERLNYTKNRSVTCPRLLLYVGETTQRPQVIAFFEI